MNPINKNFYKELIKDFPTGFAYHKIICDKEGQPCDYEFLEVNAAFEKLTGLKSSDIIGKKITEVLPDIKNGEFDWIRYYGDIALNGSKKEFEQYSNPIGKWYRINAYSPQKGYFITHFIDVTKEREQFLELDNFFRLNLGLLCIADTDGNFLRINKEWENVLGYSIEELEKRKFLEFVHPDDVESTLDVMSQLGRQEQVFNFVNRYKCKDGSYRDIEWRYQPYKGNLIYATARDITKHKQAEQALKESENKFRSFVENSRDIIYTLTMDGAFTYVSPNWKNLLGHNVSEVVGEPFTSFVLEEDVGLCFEFLEKVLKSENVLESVEYRIRNIDGQLRWHSSSGSSIEREGKRQAIGVAMDITERKQAEDKIKQYQDIANNMQVGLHVYQLEDLDDDTTLRMVATNPAAALHTGLSEEEVMGRTLDELFPNLRGTNHPQRYAEVARSGKPLEIEDTYYSDDRIVEAAFAVKVFPLPNNCVGVIFENITKRKQAEEEIVYLNYHDQLTELYNRRFFEEEMKRLNTKRNLPISIIMGDVNGLKLVNDSFGHSMGDELLKKAAEAIKKGCREDDIIARLGGDEFAVLLPNTDAKKAESIIKRIIKQSEKDKVGPIDISISFGCDTLTSTEDSIHDTLKNAENRMYTRKLYMGSSMRSKTVDLIMNTLYERNNREQMHSIRVSEICEAIAIKMNLEEDEVNAIRVAGLMHDIGKIGVGDEVLNKADKLNHDEWEEIKRHLEIGYRILNSVNEFSDIAKYVLEHHERWDGKGYPRGLKWTNISLQARIIAVADAFDAMIGYRPYRNALSEEEALSEIRRFSCTQFDPDVAKIFVEEVWGKSGFFEKEKKTIN